MRNSRSNRNPIVCMCILRVCECDGEYIVKIFKLYEQLSMCRNNQEILENKYAFPFS